MKLTKLILILSIITLSFSQETTTTAPTTSEGTTTTTDSPTTSSTTEPTSSSGPDPNEGAGQGECTENHCYFCATDGENSWCTQCGNGMAINKLTGKGRKCSEKIKVENCRETPKDDPLNVEKCAICQRGYGLDKETGKCKKLELEGCTIPALDDSGKTICKGCEGLFLKDDYSGCAEKSEDFEDIYPRHCLFGSIKKEAKCLICGHNYSVSKTGKSCPEEMVTGCVMYHPNEPSKCLLCNSDQGFYATTAVKEEENVYQQCKFNGFIVNVLSAVAGFGAFLWWI